jgi:ribosomal protein S18 acetylase RimI-like enzyme
MMNVRIREATLADVGELIELLYELFSIESDFIFDKAKQYQGLQLMLQDGKNKRVWVAETDNRRVVGMCTLQVLISTAEGGEVGLVEDVVVKKQFRCMGIGRLLLNQMEEWASEAKLLRLQLLTDKTNLPAIQFYKKMNWQPTLLICMRKGK